MTKFDDTDYDDDSLPVVAERLGLSLQQMREMTKNAKPTKTWHELVSGLEDEE